MSTDTARRAQRVPALRFPEFEGEWEEMRLEAMSKVTSGGTPSRTDPTNWDGEIPWVTTSEIGLPLVRETSQRITEAGLASSSAKLFPSGTVLVAMYGQGQTRGRVSVLGIEAATNQACAAILVEEKLRSDFCYYNLFGRYEELRELANDGGQKNLSGGLIKALKLALPSLPEQKKIAAFLGLVDAKIAGLKARQEGLERYKRGLMQALFSQRLRFTRSDGTAFPDWEEKRLGDLCDSLSGHPVAGLDILETRNDVPLLRGMNITEGRIRHSDEMDRYHGGDLTGLDRFFVQVGDVVVSMDGSKVGKNVATVGEEDAGSFLIQRVTRLRSDGQNDLRLIYQHITSKRFRKYVDIVNTSSGIPHISLKQIRDFTIPAPHPDEQQKIAETLSAMDAKIAAVAGQVAKMEEFKKGLLQQMFV